MGMIHRISKPARDCESRAGSNLNPSCCEDRVLANQHTTSALSGLQGKPGTVNPREIRLLWEMRGKIEVNEGGCWLWKGARHKAGYGSIAIRGKSLLVHRVLYRLCVGEIPDGLEVCHNCPGGDNPICCNPAHLFSGTHTDNMRDAARKGRIKARDSRGEKNPAAKLTVEKVKAILARASELADTKGKCTILAREFGVSRATASRVVRRDIWKHVQ